MIKTKSSVSRARSYSQIGEFWDEHDLGDFWTRTKKINVDVVLEPEVTYYPVEKDLSERIHSMARKKGIPSGTLVNLCLEQRVKQQRNKRQGCKSSTKMRSG
jgi:hypothetical protein